MDVTLFGIVTDVREEQNSKAELPNESNDVVMIIIIIIIIIPMDVTLLGIVTDVREVHAPKAPSPYESNDVVMINDNNNNDNTNGCNTIWYSNGCQGGAVFKGRVTY